MTIHETILEYAVSHPEQTATLAAGLGATAYHGVKTGRLPIGRLPYRALRGVLRDLRGQYFGKPRPRGVPAVVVDASPEQVAATLQGEHFEAAPASYEYKGERWSLRRPDEPRRNPETGDPTPMETHARGFELASGKTLVLTHHEANRYTATAEHLDDGLYSWERGQDRLAAVLDRAPHEYRLIGSERDAGVEVVA